ncbi:hypothetical protein ACNO65_06845 [Vibrio campbellii]|uniref:hypothetical protein n=1 Tax=Vibrio campbellii TaxID=680 RepID=UPI003AAE9145
MSPKLDLNQILLTKLNSLLNPNYVNKIILLTLTLGAGLIGRNFVLEILVALEIITPDFVVKLQLSDGASSTVFYVGVVLVFLSLWLFYQAHFTDRKKSSKSFKSLKKAAPFLIRLMEENERIFKECGPNSSSHHQDELRMNFSVWNNAKSEIIVPNNDQIYKVIIALKGLSVEESRIIAKMKSHIEHFKVHVTKGHINYSQHQFPQEFSDLVYSYKKVSRSHQKKIDRVTSWLKEELNIADIESICLFGSFLYNENYHDIDVLIKTHSSTHDDIKRVALSVKEIKSEYTASFGEDLHISIFSELEKKRYLEFKGKIRNLKEVV